MKQSKEARRKRALARWKILPKGKKSDSAYDSYLLRKTEELESLQGKKSSRQSGT